MPLNHMRARVTTWATMMENADAIESWLTERVSVEEAEVRSTPTPDQLARNPRMPNKPFGFDNERWEILKTQMIDGDELWYFCSPQETWRKLYGRAGLAVVRGGRVVETLVLLMN